MSLQSKVGSFTANTSTGNQAITGVGFQGKAILIWGSRTASTGFNNNIQWSWGCATSSSARWSFAYAEDDGTANADTARSASSSDVIRMISDATSPTIDAIADFVSFDSDGFTINWTDAPSIAGLFHYLVIGGSDVSSAKAGTFTLATSGASQSSTDPGFQPDFLLMTNYGVATATSGTTANVILGFASSASDQAAVLVRSNDNTSADSTDKWQKTGRISLGTTSAHAADHEAALSSFDATGFTLSVSDLPSAARFHGYLAIKGGQWKVGTETQKTSTGTKDTTLTFDPAAVLFAGANAVSNSSIDSASSATLSVGAGDGTTEGGTWFETVSGADPSNANRCLYDTKAILHGTSDSTTNAEADLTVGTQKFTLDWTTADATAREFIYVAMGNTTPVAGKHPYVIGSLL